MALFFGQAFFWCTSATWTPQTCTESALVVHAPRTWASNCRAPCSPPWLCTAPCGYIGSWFAHSGTQEGTGREVFQFGQPLWRTRARAAWLRHLFSHERRTHDAQPPPRGQKVRVRRVWLVGEEIGQEILNMRRIVCGPPAEIFSFWPDHFRGTLRPVFFLLAPGGVSFTHPPGLFMVGCPDFFTAKRQGASGWALALYVLFSPVALPAGCLVGGLAAVWVCGCGCGRVLPFFGGCGWLLAGCGWACALLFWFLFNGFFFNKKKGRRAPLPPRCIRAQPRPVPPRALGSGGLGKRSHFFAGWKVALIWKPRPGAKPDGRGEGNEAQAAQQGGMPARNRQPVVLPYCPSNWAIGTAQLATP